MKNLLLFALMAVVLVACEEKEDDKPFMLEPYAFVRIEPGAALVPKSTNPDHLTPLEIVKKGNIVNFYNRLAERHHNSFGTGGFNGKDTTSAVPAFLFWGTNIINVDNWGVYYLVEDWLLMEDAVIAIHTRNYDNPGGIIEHIDTIAYIPNAVARKAEAEIMAAWEAQDTEAVYRIFNEAWKFVPVTGAEYRELVKQGLQ